MFGFKPGRSAFQQRISPLVDRARTLDGAALAPWLAELRHDCPTVAAEVERELATTYAASISRPQIA
jgi:hypothetical protein